MLGVRRAAAAGRPSNANMATLIRMEKEPDHMAERILQLTMEIICLLTGETSPFVFGDHVTIKVQPLQSLMHHCDTQQKILEVTRKITELLTAEGEVLKAIAMKVKEEGEDGYKRKYDHSLEEEISLEICADPGDSRVTGRNAKFVELKEEAGAEEIGSDGRYQNNITKRCTIFPDCVPEDDFTAYFPEDSITPIPHPAQPNSTLLSDPLAYSECFPAGLLPIAQHATRRRSKKPHPNSKRGKSVSEESHLTRLARVRTVEKTYSCFECRKLFDCRSALIRHERFHTGEKPYSCLQCGKCFSLSSHLNRHQRIHRGEKPYSCLLCGKCFSQKSNLDAHERVHTGEKPYSCFECGKGFSTKVHLVVHERVHSGVKPYFCSKCGKDFSRKASLIKHKSVHRE